MRGRMMETPLLISSLIEHAGRVHRDQEIVSRTVEGPIHRYTWLAARNRSRQLAQALESSGITTGDRVGHWPGIPTGTWSSTTASQG